MELREQQAEHPNDANYLLGDARIPSGAEKLSEADLDWMIADVQGRPDHADRLLILHIAMWFITRNDNSRLTRLQQAVSGNPELTAVLEVSQSQIRWAWFHRLRYRWGDRDQWRHSWAMKRIALARKWRGWQEWWWLFRNCNRLRSGQATRVLVNLCHEATNHESRFAPSNWNALAKKRGTRVAHAVKEGCKRSWRNYTPPLPYEKPNPSEVDGRLMIGLAGIQSIGR